ncbi:hypothetical protein [Streptomyces microflavus]|uniref:hypothetical protein n=1 Tax=Streptomyces microflavus TaxID=1919 RepID=UPI0036E82678
MPRYRVTVVEEVEYEVVVEADDKEAAGEAAEELVAGDPDEYYSDTRDRTTTDTVRLREAVAA